MSHHVHGPPRWVGALPGVGLGSAGRKTCGGRGG